MIDVQNSVFWKEIFEQPEKIRRCLKENKPTLLKIAEEVKERKIKTVVFVGRGSSDHANLVGRYLFEIKCGMVASVCAPSVITAYRGAVDYSDVLMIATSQSGGARDVFEATRRCDEQGGLCVCLTNEENSLMSRAGKYQLRNYCGTERSVTAGKSYLTQVAVLTALAAYISEDPELTSGLDKLADMTEEALVFLEPQTRDAVRYYRNTEHMLLIGRGLMNALADEIELKIQETSRLDARSYGAADYRHGPIAATPPFVPVVFLIADRHTDYSTIDLLKRMKEEFGIWCTVVTNDPETAKLGDSAVLFPKEFDGIFAVFAGAVFGQMFSCLCSLSRGFNPDCPKGVSKHTSTV